MTQQHDQLPLEEWPVSLTCYLAMLRLEPQDITAHAGVIFNEAFDDLDYYTGAILRLPSGQCVALTRHKNNPEKGTVIIATDPVEKPSEQLAEVLSYLGLGEDNVTWRNFA